MENRIIVTYRRLAHFSSGIRALIDLKSPIGHTHNVGDLNNPIPLVTAEEAQSGTFQEIRVWNSERVHLASRHSILTELSLNNGTNVVATDSILEAIGKLQQQQINHREDESVHLFVTRNTAFNRDFETNNTMFLSDGVSGWTGDIDRVARSNHIHPVNIDSVNPVALGSTAAPGTSTIYSRRDHRHPFPTLSDILGVGADGGIVPVNAGGTGSNNAAGARTNLGVPPIDHGIHVPTLLNNPDRYLRSDNVWSELVLPTLESLGAAPVDHGIHVPTLVNNNNMFLRSDNAWSIITPAVVGAATPADIAALETIINSIMSDLDNLRYLSEVTHNTTTGVMTFTRWDNTTLTVQIPGLVAGAELDGDYLVIHFQGGQDVRVNLKSLIPLYTGSTGTHIQISIDPTTLQISGTLRNNTVGGGSLVNNIALPGRPTIGSRPEATSNNTEIPDTSWVRSRIGEITYSDVDAAPASHNHNASHINAGTLVVARGGTGRGTFPAGNIVTGNGTTGLNNVTPQAMRNTMGLGDTLGVLPQVNGGTGHNSLAAALLALPNI